MTLDELIEKARAKGPWEVSPVGRIRNKKMECPLGAVFGADYIELAKRFGLDVYDIIDAADRTTADVAAIRAKLMTLIESEK